MSFSGNPVEADRPRRFWRPAWPLLCSVSLCVLTCKMGDQLESVVTVG